jgi:micrococcal nuclease
MKTLTFLVFSLFALPLSAESAERYPTKKCKTSAGINPIKAKILAHSDGDTITVLFSDKTQGKVRFLAVDTPELHFEGKSQGAPGERAASRLTQLLPKGAEVELQFEVSACDMYGRYLAYVHKEGKDINRQMVLEGFAANFCFAPAISRCQDYLQAAKDAARSRVSLFVAEKVEYPHEFRIRTSGKLEAPYVGNMETKKVLLVRSLDEMRPIPPEQRIFFLKKTDIQAPYILVP